MRSVRALWQSEPRSRWFFAAHLQGGLGAGAGYIALMLLAYERIGSAWAATAVMLADLIPSMLLGPLLGGLVDRTSRLGCAIASDVLRASVFAAPDVLRRHRPDARARAAVGRRQRPLPPRDRGAPALARVRRSA